VLIGTKALPPPAQPLTGQRKPFASAISKICSSKKQSQLPESYDDSTEMGAVSAKQLQRN